MNKLYTTKTCGECRRAKKLLKEYEIEFVEIDVETLEGYHDLEERCMFEKLDMPKNLPVFFADDGYYWTGGDVVVGIQGGEIQ